MFRYKAAALATESRLTRGPCGPGASAAAAPAAAAENCKLCWTELLVEHRYKFGNRVAASLRGTPSRLIAAA